MAPTWDGMLVCPDEDFDGAPLLRREFVLEQGHGEPTSATWAVTAHGIFQAYLNGLPVSDEVLSPGWSSYEWRLRYREYDVLDLLAAKAAEPVVLGLALGNGWYRGRLAWMGRRNTYGDELGALASLEIRFGDGHVQTVVTDLSWQAGPSAVLANDLYDGQTVDARKASDDWLRPGFEAAEWVQVHEGKLDRETLTPYIGPVVHRIAELSPTRIWAAPSGRVLVDFGQNITGWVRAKARGTAGDTVTLRHAEVLEHDELGVRPLRTAQATDRFVLSGGDDAFEPTFTFHGFRYAEVDGWPGGIDSLQANPAALTAVAISSDLERIGHFECSGDLLNQLHRNIVWSTSDNFVDVPTDCPQRDERLGWTGDIAAFAPSAAFLFDVDPFLRDWLRDLAAEQQDADGMVAFVIPDVLKYNDGPTDFPVPDSTAIWSDAAVWVPWALYQAYGDSQVLADQYDSMSAHVRRVESKLSPTGLWDSGFQFGDWLDPTAPPNAPFRAKADNGVVATACLYRSADLVAKAAELLGRLDDAAAFAGLADRTRAAFNEHYVEADGRIASDAATVYALAIHFGLLDEATTQQAGDRLAELVAAGGHHIQTGFAGTPFVTDALTLTGHLDDAYRLLLQRECPSWLYPVTMGATTIWERWDSMLPDGSINSGEMTSFNHYALGAVADWMHRTIGGIRPLEPGYSTVLIAPQPGGGLTWADTSLNTRHGQIRVRWDLRQDQIDVSVTLPDEVKGIARLPGREDQAIGPGQHRLTAPASHEITN